MVHLNVKFYPLTAKGSLCTYVYTKCNMYIQHTICIYNTYTICIYNTYTICIYNTSIYKIHMWLAFPIPSYQFTRDLDKNAA